MRSGDTNQRFVAMLLAVAISYGTVLLPPEAIVPSGLSGLRGLGLVGAPVAALLGWWLTARVAGARWRIALAVGLGIGALAAVLGVLAIAYLQLLHVLATEPDPEGSSVVLVLFIAVIGLPYAVLAMPVTIPCGLLWAVTTRLLFRRRLEEGQAPAGRLGVQHLVIVLVVIAMGAGLVPLATGT